MPKGNRRPTNNALLRLTSELMDYLASMPNPKGIPREFLIIRGFLKSEEKGFSKLHSKEIFEDHMKRFNRNRTEMARDKLKRLKESLEERKKRDSRKERELIVEEKKIANQIRNTDLRENRENDGEIENPDCPKCGASGNDIATVQNRHSPDSYQCLKCKKEFIIKKEEERSKLD